MNGAVGLEDDSWENTRAFKTPQILQYTNKEWKILPTDLYRSKLEGVWYPGACFGWFDELMNEIDVIQGILGKIYKNIADDLRKVIEGKWCIILGLTPRIILAYKVKIGETFEDKAVKIISKGYLNVEIKKELQDIVSKIFGNYYSIRVSWYPVYRIKKGIFSKRSVLEGYRVLIIFEKEIPPRF